MDQVDAINNDGPKLVLNFADKDETELEKIPFLEIVTLNSAFDARVAILKAIHSNFFENLVFFLVGTLYGSR